MALILSLSPPGLTDLGLAKAGARAQAKLREAFPDQTRRHMAKALTQFPVAHTPARKLTPAVRPWPWRCAMAAACACAPSLPRRSPSSRSRWNCAPPDAC